MDGDVEKVFHFEPGSNRIGQFNIMHEVLRDGRERPMLQALFGLCVVLDTEDHESGRGKTYFASSELFQPLLEGEEIPEYRIERVPVAGAFPDPEHQARRLVSGGFAFVAIRKIIVRVPPAELSMHPRKPRQPLH